jgi:hypothetical protein
MGHTPTTTAHIWEDTDSLVRGAQELMNGNPTKTAIYHQAVEQFVAEQKGGDSRDA